MVVKCKNCSKRYDYREHGCCPECGAYNRPPQWERVTAEGTVYHVSDEDFLDNTEERRRSMTGKVCFDRSEHEHPTVKTRSKEDVDVAQFAAHIEKAVKRRAKSVKKSGKTAAIIAVLSVMLPALISICGLIFEDRSSYIEPLPPDYVTDYNDFGDTVHVIGEMNGVFTWWGEDAIITDFEVLHNGNLKEAVITAYRLTDVDQPLLYYSQRNVEWMDMMTYDYVTDLGNDYYSYHYFLPKDTVVGETDFMALCSGYNGEEYVETEIWLTPQ
ncbi:MAG: hypothetical protein IKV68_00210 [Oscillospiraceae bacterium]|nr:hypothetical protein [Oscillospiraceae bacterium]